VHVAVAIVVFLLLFVVLFVISAPLRAGGFGRRSAGGESPEQVDLEAAREAKYREIRDAELDFRTGKLSTEDYAATDGALRAEAVEILDRLEAVEEGDAAKADADADPNAVEADANAADADASAAEAEPASEAKPNPEVEG
jgi:flagellar biosynthesis/type III secretory pathway M-ring protein FliF/YscJ